MRSLQDILKPRPAKPEPRLQSDKRFAPRRKGDLPAIITFDGTPVTVPCLIKDMSTTGARLLLRQGWDNPFKSSASAQDRVRLILRMDRVMYECKIVRRGETELGVKFLSAAKPYVTKVVPSKSAAKKVDR